MQRPIGADRNRPQRRTVLSRHQRRFEGITQLPCRIDFVVGERMNVIVDEALPGDGAVEIEHAFVASGVRRGGGRREYCVADVGQEPFEANVGDRVAFQQAAKELSRHNAAIPSARTAPQRTGVLAMLRRRARWRR